jgi:hypothetical protein
VVGQVLTGVSGRMDTEDLLDPIVKLANLLSKE